MGYIQWQGFQAQKRLLEDMKDDLHINLAKKDLHKSRPEYYENFPLDVFRDKIAEEIWTTKYMYTMKMKGKTHQSS
jgi:hypothetical protein